MIHYQLLGRAHDPRNGGRCSADALAGRRISPELQTTDRVRKVPVPQGGIATPPLDLLLFGLGVVAPACAGHWPEYVPGPPIAMGPLPAGDSSEAYYSVTYLSGCVSPVANSICDEPLNGMVYQHISLERIHDRFQIQPILRWPQKLMRVYMKLQESRQSIGHFLNLSNNYLAYNFQPMANR